MNAPIRVAVTGAAGQIGYSLLFRIASGAMFGSHQPLILHLIEIAPAMPALQGLVMELEDGGFPLLKGVVATSNLDEGFRGVNWALLVGSVPRKPGIERKDLLGVNGRIFIGQGLALQKNAAPDVRVLVVGNPCNTNCLIAMNSAPEIPRKHFYAMTRLDENRAKAQLAKKLGALPGEVARVGIWGNHSDTMFPDYANATVRGKAVTEQVGEEWLQGEFLKTVATRGKAIIEARGASSAASAASAAIDHMATLWHGNAPGDFTSMGVWSNGEYGVPKGLIFSYPVTSGGGNFNIVPGLEHGEFAKARIAATTAELLSERETVKDLLK